MLHKIRKNAQSWMIKSVLWLVVAAFVGTIFLVWGRGRDVGEPEVVATVEGMPIYLREVQKVYSDLFSSYRRLFKEGFDEKMAQALNLKRVALDSLLTRKLLLLEASRAGFAVSDGEVFKRLESFPAFSPYGRFDRNLYLRTLRANRIEPEEFERDLKASLIMEKYELLIKDGVKVSPAELFDAYTQENERATINYIAVKSGPLRQKVNLDEAELKKFYEDNKATFREPDRAKVKYLFIDASKLKEGAAPGEEEMKKYYEQHKDDFSIRKEKEVRARHILIRAASDAPEVEVEKAKQKALDLLDRIKKGADFAEIATKHSEDASASAGGDLGYFKRGLMVKPFEEAVFSLKPGEVSDLVRSQYGFHIVKVEDVREPQIEPFEAVKAKISDAIIAKRDKERAKELAYKVSSQVNLDQENLDELAAKFSTEVATTEFFAKNELVKGVGLLASFNNAAFALETGGVSEVIEGPAGYYIIALIEKKEEHQSSFEEARKLAESALKTEKSMAMAKSEAERLKGLLVQGKSLAEVALEPNLQVQSGGPFKRGDNLPGLGVGSEPSRLAFSLKQGESAVARVGSDYYLLEVVKRERIDASAFEKEKADFEKKLTSRKNELFYQEWLQRLKESANIKINEAKLTF